MAQCPFGHTHATASAPASAQDKPALPLTIPELVQAAANHYGTSVFLEEGHQKISFREFRYLAFRIAHALSARGIERGDRVAIWAPNISEWVMAAIGAQCAGAVLVTLNTRYKGAEAAYILAKSRAKVLFCIGQFLDIDYPAMIKHEDLPELQEIITFRDEAHRSNDIRRYTHWDKFLLSANDSSPVAPLAGTDISDILFTSGTTGHPKGVMTSHEQNLRAFASFAHIVGFAEGDRYLVINPFFHSFGYKAGILVCLIKGVTLLPHAVFNTDDVLKRIAADKISVLPGAPTLFQSILAHPALDSFDISTLKRATTGAAVIPVEMIRQMKLRLGFETVITAYGLTESCGLVSMCRQGDDAELIATTSGRAIPHIEVRCVDTENREVPRGEPGEIVVRGYNVMQGYFENPQATDDAIDADGWLHTGDIAVMDEAGNLRITDRMKDMFITGGFNCYPAEIEKIIANHPAVAMAAVIGIPDERMGEVARAYIVLKAGHRIDERAMIAWCREQMANFKVPRNIVFVDALPLNASGKVLKTELRKL